MKATAERALASDPGLSTDVPASDRYVAISHNERKDISKALDELGDAVRGDNEASEEDRLIALSEIAVFEASIIQPRTSTELIDRFVGSILKWITSAFSKATVSEVAKRLIEALMKLL